MLIRRKREGQSHVVRGLVGAAAVVIVIAGLQAARPVLVPLLVAAFVSLACVPAMNGLRRLRVPNVLAVILVVLGIVAVVGGIGLFVGSSVTAFVQALPSYDALLDERVEGVLDWLRARSVEVPDRAGLVDAIDPGAALGFAAVLLNELGGLLTNGFLILITVVFILLEAGSFGDKLRWAFDTPDAAFRPVAAFMAGMKQYFVIKTAVSLLTGTVVAVWLAILGIDFPLLWGLVAFLLNYVPNIGSIIAAIPPMLLALVQLGVGSALLVVVGFLVVNLVMGNFAEPRWMGHGVGLSPLVVFLALVVWGWILGPVGLLLSVPLTMTLKIAAQSNPETRWLAVLLGPEDAPPVPEAPELAHAGVDVDALDDALDEEVGDEDEPFRGSAVSAAQP